MKLAAFFAVLVIPSQVMADTDKLVRFIACPVYRDADAGKKSGCWLADDRASGIRYDVSLSPTKPDWNFEMLVEGKVSDVQSDACGSTVLDAARVSVLEGHCTRQMLPAEGYKGRVFVLPKRNVRPLSEARVIPVPPYTDRSFNLFFEFNRSFIVYQYGDVLLDETITWLRAAKPMRIIVTGYADTRPSDVSGRVLKENPTIARERAEMAVEALERLGIDRKQITVKWKIDAAAINDPNADGLPDQSRRRVEIRAEMD